MIVDLFAGPGGWDVGAAALDLHPIGIENDPAACATRYAAGLATWQQSVPDVTDDQLDRLAGHVDGLIASPPCQDFSKAGKGAGIDGDKGELMWQVPRWADALRPRWIACEQVPPAEAWFRLFAHHLRAAGYSTWCGVLCAADYGVPQTRRRVFLLASLERAVTPPDPTHAEGGAEPSLFTPGLAPWVTMADALGWAGNGRVGFARADDRGDSPDGYRERDRRAPNEPSHAVTGKARSWTLNTGRDWKPGGTRADAQTIDPAASPAPAVTGKSGGQWQLNPGRTPTQPNRRTYDLNEPAPTIAFGHDAAGWQWITERRNDQTGTPADVEWPTKRPATTIAGRGLVPDPGANANRFNDATKSRNDGYRITAPEAGVLQSFPVDYPWQGSTTAQFQQIGNAVPPLMARAVLEHLAAR